MITHEVLNQAPDRVDVNEFESNAALVDAVKIWGTDAASALLTEAGALVGSADFQRDAELAGTHEPVLHTHDRHGNRIDEVEYHPAYHRVIGDAIARGAHTSAWAEPKPGASVDRAAMFSLFAQVEPGHACPISMTHAGAAILKAADLPGRDEWWARAMSRDYVPSLHSPSASRPASGDLAGRLGDEGAEWRPTALFGMAMTEKQGGSDVRANTTRATPNADGSFSITGHKWFCSAPMSDAFFVLAKTGADSPEPKLSCFFVPRTLPDGTRNTFLIQRLKDKLGNRSNASSEVEFDGTIGWLVGEEGRGVRAILPMVSRTRLDCVIGTAAGMRQSVAEAAWHVRHRSAFGRTLIDQPAMTAVIADLQLEAEAATFTAMRLARAHDEDAEGDAGELAFRRLATAVAKYLVCKRGPAHAYEALECLGGNGYTEAFPLARRYREQPVMAIWEGSGNVIALDVLRALAREPESFHAFFTEVGIARGDFQLFDEELDAVQDLARRLRGMLQEGSGAAELRAREFTERLGVLLEASLMLRYAPIPVAGAFVAARIGHPSALFGSLPTGIDLAAMVARA
ncbi:acyl-CoA dehydrogenase family protein [Gryllotalpicola daejeonensis]|uniref:Acyl-CoA dehydrogenase family protein n=1 Tax=Gryllotalpicola daejeonensis TaxID=993087 RepID=A0ABP7ZLB6_9MICO